MNTPDNKGMSLIEMMVVISVIGILAVVVGGTYFESMSSQNRVKAATKELVADLQNAQTDAASQGAGLVVNGQLARRSEFVVFNTAANSYSIWRYEDTNRNSTRDVGEAIRMPGFVDSVDGKPLPGTLTFGLNYKTTAGGTATVINKIGDCLGTTAATAGAPLSAVSFAAQADLPCEGKRCVEISANGFLVTKEADGTISAGILYLSNEKDAYAVKINPAGLVTMCSWSVEDEKWVDTH